MSGISLGEDLEIEILVRLPAKSLMRFKCVQRTWNVLFKTPTFVTRHMHMSDDHSLMILRDENFHSFKHRDRITLLSCDNPTPTRTLKSPFPNNSCSASIYSHGHCNGVFCLEGSDSQLILWNPTTREVHLIPPPPSHYCPFQFCGFGADPNTNHFKVVHLNVCYKTGKRYLSSAEIYNLNTKSWTPIHRPVLPPCPNLVLRLWSSKYNTLVNCVYHWITCYSRDGVPNILCFDFRKNQFRELTAPISCLLIDSAVRDDIAEVNGSLAYVVEYHGPTRLGIWVMDQLGWVKKYSIGPFELIVCIRGIWEDDAQVLGGKVGEPLTVYDHDGNPIRQFQIDVDYGYFRIHEYVQSIAPLST